ncbi:MAG: hypothetical protein HZC01_02965 [Candidatus Kerfeldbacteria bacterium]|nr:hypothetical protein [Candidatus Kerfeldbacteria bacterium]
MNILIWLWQNLLWEVIVLVVIVLLPSIFKALIISKWLLKDNRNTRDNGWGTYYADRFVNIWNASKELPLRYGKEGEHYALTFGGQARHWLNVMDNKLKELSLISPEQTDKGWIAARPIRTFRNKLIYLIIKDHLIRVIGDNPQYYRDQETQRGRKS